MYISGSFSAVYNALAVGIVDDGFTLNYSPMGEDITADNAGDVVQGSIFRGVNVSVGFTVKEYDAAAIFNLTWPWATNLADSSTWGSMALVGTEIKADMAKPLVLTSCNWDTTLPSSTPSAPGTAGTITFYKTCLMNGNQVQLNLNSRIRQMPLMLRVYAVPSDYDPLTTAYETLGPCPVGMKFFEAT